MTKGWGILVAIVLALCAVVPTPAQAIDLGPLVGNCQVNFGVWPGRGSAFCGSGSLPMDGKAPGAFLPGGPICLPLCSFGMSIDSYDASCTFTSEASGTMSISNGIQARSMHYGWQTVGASIVVVLDGGASGEGAGTFVMMPPLPTCAAPGALTAHVAGLTLHAVSP